MKTVAHVTLRIGSALVAAGLAGCAVPTFAIETAPVGAAIYVDGRHVFTRTAPIAKSATDSATGTATGAESAAAPGKQHPSAGGERTLQTPLPYYGTTAVTGTMPTNDWLDVRRRVTVDEPFSPWLVPFDFVLECVTYPFRADGRYTHQVTIAVPARPEAIRGVRPRDIPALEARAKAALGER